MSSLTRATATCLQSLLLCAIPLLAIADRHDPAPIPDSVVQKMLTAQDFGGRSSVAEALEKHLSDLDDIAHQPETTLQAKGVQRAMNAAERRSASQTRRTLAMGKSKEIAALREQAREEFSQTRQRLVSLGLTDKVRAWDELLNQVEHRFERLDRALSEVDTDDEDRRGRALTRLGKEIQSMHGDAAIRELGKELPGPTFRQDEPPTPQPVVPSDKSPEYLSRHWPGNNVYAFLGNTLLAAAPATPAEAASCNYVADDLAATPDAPQTTEIKALAAQLNYSPAKIFQYVSNNIKFEPYYGSLKGAATTLQSKAGGPTDQASLLIALLRASNIPARYVLGQVQFHDALTDPTGGRVARWVGAKTYTAAAKILAQGRFSTATTSSGGVSYVQVNKHVWVEACVAYGHYRGASLDTSGQRWIPLDPSIKDKSYQSGIATSVTFDYGTYLAQRTNGPDSLPQEAYAKQVEASIRATNPNASLADVPYQGTPKPITVDILPSSLPYTVVAFVNWAGTTSPEIAQLPAAHRYRFAISGLGLATPYSMEMPTIAQSRITLAFKGATSGDQTALDSWRANSDMALAIPCTINVQPVLRADGSDQLIAGSTVGVCTKDNTLSLGVYLDEAGASATVNSVTFTNIGAVNLHALQAYAFQGSDTLLTKRSASLLNAVNTTASPNTNAIAQDNTLGEFMHIAGLKFMRYVADSAKTVGSLNGSSGERGNTLGLVSSQMKVQYLFDLPYAVSRTGFLLDVPGGVSRDVSLSTGSFIWNNFKLSGFSSSAYESYIWQEVSRLDAVSTVRGLQFANETGIGTVVATSANWSTVRAQLSVYPGASMTDCTSSPSTLQYPRCIVDSTSATSPGIKGLIDLGYTVTMPKSLIQYGDWKGVVYMSERNVANAADTRCPSGLCATYSIGPLNGGYTVGTRQPSTYSPTLNTGYKSPPEVVVSQQPANNPAAGTNSTTMSNGASAHTTFAGDPVNMVTGNMYHTERDISLKARGGLPIVFERSYNSRNPVDGPLGYGWTHSFNQMLKLQGVEGGLAKLSWIDGTGAEKFFATATHTNGNLTANTVIPNPAGVFVTFKRQADGSFTITEKNGLIYRFESKTGPSGIPGAVGVTPVYARLLSITDRNGNTLTLAYTTACGNQLCSVTDGIGRAINFTYNGTRIDTITDWSGRQWKYSYDLNGNLSAFNNPLAVAGTQNSVHYSYYTAADGQSLNHLMKQYTLPRGNGMQFDYYANGRTFRHTVVNSDGSLAADQVNTFSYNDFRRETVQVSERGGDRHFFFDANGNPLKIIEESGAAHSYEYTQSGQPFNRTASIDALGRRTQYNYDTNGNVTQTIAPSGATTNLVDFTAFNQPRRVQDAMGHWRILRYDTHGNLTDSLRVADSYVPPSCASAECALPPANAVMAWTVNGYDANGNRTSSKRVRDVAAQLTTPTATSATGPIVSYGYDANRLNVISLTRSGNKNLETSASTVNTASLIYDALGRLKTGVDADWYPTQFSYDAVDHIIQATDKLGKLRDYRYDANGNLTGQQLTVSDAGTPTLVDSSSTLYDDADRPLQKLDAGGFVTAYTYDGASNPLSITNPDGYTVNLDYDDANHVILAYDPLNHTVTTDRDIDGRVRNVTDPNGNVVAYDYWDTSRDGRLKSVTAPTIQSYTSGRATSYDYDLNGNATLVTEVPAASSTQTNRISRTTYDELNRPVRATGPEYTDATLGQTCPVTTWRYDALGRAVEIKAGTTPSPCTTPASDALKTQTTRVYDDFDRLSQETDALGRAWITVHDAHNNIASITDPKAQTTTFTWDTGQQLLTRTEQGGRLTSYTRNALGQVLTLEHPETTTRYTYDTAHRLTQVSDSRPGMPQPKTLRYDWSPGGLLNSITDSDGRVTTYRYDAAARLAGMTAPNGDAATYRFDAGGRLIEKLLISSTASGSPGSVSSRYQYNADDSLRQLVNRNTATTILSQHDYTYDGVGNRITQAEKIGATTLNYSYTYDELKRLTQVGNGTATQQEAYTYDGWNNRTGKQVGATTPVITAYQYDDANQLTAIHSGSLAGPALAILAYDNNGNLTGDGTRTLTWDALNQLTRVISGSTTVNYAYNGEGQRISKTIGATTTQWLYDGDNAYAEYGNSWTTPTAITTYVGTDRPQIRALVTGSASYGTATYLAQDGIDSVIASSNSADATTATQRFDAWGNKLATTGTIPQFGFTGREPDETGLVYYRARYYDPTTARFASRDPIGLQGGINLYAYVNNNPVNFNDPEGLLARQVGNAAASYFGTVSQAALNTLPSQQSFNNFLDKTQTTLDYVGLAAQGPLEVAAPFIDAASAGVSLLRGDYTGAGLSGMAAIPFVGSVFNATKVGREAVEGVKDLKPTLIQENPRNLIPTQTKAEMSGSQVQRLTKDMKQNGFDQSKPVDAWRNPNTGRLEIQNGHHRTEAAKKAGLDKIPVQVWE